MSADHLPEDVRQWPQDPHRILDVAQGVDLQTARRAYTRLIRKYKPEQYPEQFRRIREAYETVQRYSQYQMYFPPVEPNLDLEIGPPGSFPAPAEEMAPDEANPMPNHVLIPRPTADLDALWEKACQGQDREAYRAMRELADRDTLGGELPLRLYWLLKTNPELDADRHPCAWLVRGLRDHALAGPCRELYRREIEDHPAEAVSERFEQLLACPAAPRDLADFLTWRWQAAARLLRPEVVERDLDVFRSRLASDEDSWAHLLLRAADLAAWFRSTRHVFDRCRQEIEELYHVHLALGESLARLDFLAELSSTWQDERLRSLAPPGLLNSIPLSWHQPWDEIRERFLTYAVELAVDPRATRNLFDDIQSVAPAVLTQFGQTLSMLQDYLPWVDRNQQPIRDRIAVFTRMINLREYPYARDMLFGYCLRELVDPDTVAEVLEEKAGGPTEISIRLRDDWPLRYACLIYRIVWT